MNAEVVAPNFDFAPTISYMMRAGAPREAIAKFSSALAEIVKLPEVIERLAALGIKPVGSTPDEQAAAWKAHTERYSKAMVIAGAKAK